MVEFKWDATLEIGHEVVDSQHHAMVDLINQLQHAATETQSVDSILPVFDQLERYTLYHFAEEEAIMREIGFEFYEAHVAEHDHVRQQLSKFHAAIHSEDANPKEVVAFLVKWLVIHIFGSDSLIGESIRRKQSGAVLAA